MPPKSYQTVTLKKETVEEIKDFLGIPEETVSSFVEKAVKEKIQRDRVREN